MSASAAGSRWLGLTQHAVALVIQAGLTVLSLTAIALVLMLGTGPVELLSFIAWPIYSIIAAVVTFVGVAVAGLPLRLVPALRRWWMSNAEVMLFGAALGVVLIIGSFLWAGSDQILVDPDSGIAFTQFVPDGWTLLTGWLLVGFSLAHIWWPRRWTRAGVRMFRSLIPGGQKTGTGTGTTLENR